VSAPTDGIDALLGAMGLFTDAQVATVLDAVRDGRGSVTEMVVSEGVAEEIPFLEGLAERMGLAFVRLGGDPIEPEVLRALPTKVVFQHAVMPCAIENNVLLVATNNPFDVTLPDTLRVASGGRRVRLVLSPSDDINDAVKRFYGVGADTVDRMMEDDRFDAEDTDIPIGKVDLNDLDQEASIVKFVNQVIWEAFKEGATDIHIEPMEEQLRIRYRVDGVLHAIPVSLQLNRFQAAIISRIKVMANLDIAEKRLPMDGRIGLRIQGNGIDIRVSTMPTVYGESVSMRLLQSGGDVVGLRESGMNEGDIARVRKIIHRPNGIVLVTGPTGSGKSTSLFGYLQEVNEEGVRIMTAENPIEYEIKGVNQVLVQPDIGLTFAAALRSFLRQDPDIIMVGEIRDVETAEIAIQASLTGHLVFSTLHTNDAGGAFTRLLDMGVEPYLLASAVEGVVAQRLVRRLCERCRVEANYESSFLEEVQFPRELYPDATLYKPGGCDACRGNGFRGRSGIFEVLAVSERIRSMVTARAQASDVSHQSIAEGMTTLRDDGWGKVVAGITTVDEVLRVTEDVDV
jgi:type II secretion system protein E